MTPTARGSSVFLSSYKNTILSHDMTPTARGSSVFPSSYKNTILSQSVYVFSLSYFLKGGKSTAMVEHTLVFIYFDSHPWTTKNYTKVFFKTIFYLTSSLHEDLKCTTLCTWYPVLTNCGIKRNVIGCPICLLVTLVKRRHLTIHKIQNK